MKYVISATRPGLPTADCTEQAHTRQIVNTEAEAARIVAARNSAELKANPITGGIYRWGYYAEGCGKPIRVAGTSGGTMHCGGMLKDIAGNIAQEFCDACQPKEVAP